ncbi:MAG: putative tRNA threonylcarbamoyladenosine biosynthesis protein Gcp, partial [Parcubacteria group bacterium GW2011_GWC2_45_7]
MRILGIETSCDETAAAVVEASSGKRLAFRVLSNVVASQVKIHAKTGGVVPEVAARAHAEAIIPIVRKALHEAGIRSQASGRRVDWLKSNPETLITNVPNCLDVIAVTAGP